MHIRICLIGLVDKFDATLESLKRYADCLRTNPENEPVTISLILLISNIVSLRHNIDGITTKNDNVIVIDHNNPLTLKHATKSTNYKIENLLEVVKHLKETYKTVCEDVTVRVVDDIAFDQSAVMAQLAEKTNADHLKYTSDVPRSDLRHLLLYSHFLMNKFVALQKLVASDHEDTIYVVNRFDCMFFEEDACIASIRKISSSNVMCSRAPLFSTTFVCNRSVLTHLDTHEYLDLDVHRLPKHILDDADPLNAHMKSRYVFQPFETKTSHVPFVLPDTLFNFMKAHKEKQSDHTLNYENTYRSLFLKAKISLSEGIRESIQRYDATV